MRWRGVSTADRIHGALLGTLIGDAFGRPFEGIARGDARLREAIRARAAAPRHWDHSDDGEMALAVAESVTTLGRVDEAHLLATLAARHEPARGYGKGMRAAFRAFERTGDWRAAPHALWPEGSRGNGCVVRVAGVAAWYVEDELEVVSEAAARSAAPTHAHPDAIGATRAMTLALWHLLRGGPPSTLRSWLASVEPASARLLRPVVAVDVGTFAPDSLALALTVMSSASGFADAVQAAVALGHDTDTNGAMVGALAGAAYGRGAIPADWIAALPPPVVRRTAALALGLYEKTESGRWTMDVCSVAASAGEDRVWAETDADGGWIVVADGAGGAGRGAEAADYLVERVRQDRPVSGRSIVSLLESIDLELAARASGLTTAVVLRLQGGRAVGASVGDSVAWVFGPDGCEELTEHQSRRPLVGSGEARPRAFVRSGVERVVLATDGVSAFLPADRLTELAERGATARELVDAVRLASGTLRDDATVALAELSS